MAAHFFEKRLCQMNLVALSGMGFDCFMRYFCCVNSQNESLKMESPVEDFLVLRFNQLVGLDTLWEIALVVDSSVVFKESMSLLVQLYQKVSSMLQKEGEQR